MRYLFDEPVLRLRVTPDAPERQPGEPPPITAPHRRGSRRPHADGTHAQVRALIETTTLAYGEIAQRPGVGRASICRWTRDGGWMRPPFAPRATDTVPTARASQKLKLRKLAERLCALAEHFLRTLEARHDATPDDLMRALQVLKMARLEAQGRHRRRRAGDCPALTGRQWIDRDTAIRTALREMRRGGVDLAHVPHEAMELLEGAHTPVDDHPALRARRARRRHSGID